MRNELNNPKAVKECASIIVNFLLENDVDSNIETFQVWKFGDDPQGRHVIYAFETPGPFATDNEKYVNYYDVPTGQDALAHVENHMRSLAKNRDYPAGSFFATPWGEYLIHGGTIGKI